MQVARRKHMTGVANRQAIAGLHLSLLRSLISLEKHRPASYCAKKVPNVGLATLGVKSY